MCSQQYEQKAKSLAALAGSLGWQPLTVFFLKAHRTQIVVMRTICLTMCDLSICAT